MENIQSGIYRWRNLINDKSYIGSAVDFNSRKSTHLTALRRRSHHSEHFQNAWNLYGEENFKFEIVERILRFENETDIEFERRLCKEKEQFYLDQYGAQEYIRKESYRFVETTYNINPTAGSALGRITSEQGKKNNSNAQLALLKIKCIYCEVEVPPSKINRWHNENCLQNPNINLEIEKKKRKNTPEAILLRSKSLSITRATEESKLIYKRALADRPLLTCPHCEYESYNKGSIMKSHFDNCKQNPNYDSVAAEKKLQKAKDKAKQALQDRPLLTCHCGKESYNKGWMALNHFDNCGKKRTKSQASKDKLKQTWADRKLLDKVSS